MTSYYVPTEPIGGNGPQGGGWRIFGIFSQDKILDYVVGISDFTDRRFPWNCETLSEKTGCKYFSKTLGVIFFEVESAGRKNSEVLLQTFQSGLVPADLTNIKQKNKYNKSDLHSLQNTLSWDSRVNSTADLWSGKVSMTACASTFSTKTFLAHNKFSLVRTQYMVHIPHCIKNNPLPPPNGQSPTIGITPTSNATSQKKPPKQIPHIPNVPDSDPSS